MTEHDEASLRRGAFGFHAAILAVAAELPRRSDGTDFVPPAQVPGSTPPVPRSTARPAPGDTITPGAVPLEGESR